VAVRWSYSLPFSNQRAWLESEGEGIRFWGFPDRGYCEKSKGAWVAAGELVGKVRGEAWERQGMVWECSLSKQLNQDGLMEKIDGGVRGSTNGPPPAPPPAASASACVKSRRPRIAP
jgi:hypothetical protein